MPIMNIQIKGGGITPTQTLSITTNGVHDVTSYAYADVQVPNPSTGTLTVTSNATYNVTNYASVDVQVPTTAPAHYIEKTVDANGKLVKGTNIINLNGVTDVGDYVLYYAYYLTQFPANTSVDFSSLTNISGQYACSNMFYNCLDITSVDLGSLITVSGDSACASMFQACQVITSIDLSSLTTISGKSACNSMFRECYGITSVDLSSLTTISGQSACSSMFYYSSGITSADLSGLTTVSGSSACSSMFRGCTSLTTVYIGGATAIDFGTQTNQFTNLFNGCSQNIDVYAPAANQTQIEAFSGYPNFGGTGTVTWHWRS